MNWFVKSWEKFKIQYYVYMKLYFIQRKFPLAHVYWYLTNGLLAL